MSLLDNLKREIAVKSKRENQDGWKSSILYISLGLKTAKGTKQLKLDPSIYENLQKERVEVCYLYSNERECTVYTQLRNLSKVLNY